MRVLVACEFSGVVRDAFHARGHDAISIDLLPTERAGPHIARVHREPPSPERWKNRSRTLEGIARAMAEQWG